MSAADEPIFRQDANATLASEIRPPEPDPREARVSRMHRRIVKGVRDGSIYREPRKPR